MASGEEVTGLHAFDELDPVSTVSALNVMPDEEPAPLRSPAGPPKSLPPAPPQRFGARSAPPPPPPRSSLPPPPSSARPPAQLGRSLPPMTAGRPSPLPPARLAPPPPRGGLGGASVPPMPTRTVTDLGEDNADTRVVPNAYEHDPDHSPTARDGLQPVAGPSSYDTFVDSDADHTSVRIDPNEGATQQNVPVAAAAAGAPPIDDTALLELSATTVATDIDMDWDEEEVATELRDEGVPPGRGPGLAAGPTLGNPSPFSGKTTMPPGAGGGMFGVRPGVRSSFPPPPPVQARASQPAPADWEDEDEALTRVREPADLMPPAGAVATTWSGFAPPHAARQSTVDIDSPFEEPHRNRWPWAVLAAAAVIGAAIAAKTLLQDEPGAATVTLVTKPGDAEVSIDGRSLVGQTSPFMVQDLAPGVDHEVVVKKEGFEPQTRRFRVAAGQVMPLDGIELTKLDSGTGFALATVPAGAKVYVDGTAHEGVTPLRVTDLKPGLHTIRVEHPDGKPWESQVALAPGQVIDLPTADLTTAAAAAPPAKAEKAEAPRERERVASSGSSSRRMSAKARRAAARAERNAEKAAARAERAARKSAPAVRAPAPAPTRMVAAAPAAGGSEGILRVNSRPWSQVFVDGRLIGNTPLLNVPLKAGKHKVKLVNPELGMSKQLTVDIDKGKATTKVVELQ